MKVQMDVIAIYSGVDFDSATEFYMARIRTKTGEESDVPIDKPTFSQLMNDFVRSVTPPSDPPERSSGTQPPVRIEPGEKRGKKGGGKPAPKVPAAQGDDDGFSPLPEMGEAGEGE